jgi:ABC-type polysaccharide/polyol phosphate export permease
MAGVLEIYRAPLLDGRPPAADALAWAAAMTVVFVLAGSYLFRRLEPDLDDHL